MLGIDTTRTLPDWYLCQMLCAPLSTHPFTLHMLVNNIHFLTIMWIVHVTISSRFNIKSTSHLWRQPREQRTAGRDQYVTVGCSGASTPQRMPPSSPRCPSRRSHIAPNNPAARVTRLDSVERSVGRHSLSTRQVLQIPYSLVQISIPTTFVTVSFRVSLAVLG